MEDLMKDFGFRVNPSTKIAEGLIADDGKKAVKWLHGRSDFGKNTIAYSQISTGDDHSTHKS
jgi:hypothetical protein